jgi:Stealth protein CR2, conserved region 2/Stealth protein CR4, conserved region 4/Stealth protein CR3, conserved region 3
VTRHARDAPGTLDVVYTWVDGAFPGYSQLLESYAQTTHDRNPNRYRDNLDLLKFSLRSLERYAGALVRDVYLVTMRPQIPPWLDPSASGLHVVHHDAIMPADELPTFNSFAIVSHLRDVPGLSERFLYMEDDRLFGAPVSLEDFVGDDGALLLYAKPIATPRAQVAHDATQSPWNNALAYCNALLDARYGAARRGRIQHAPVVFDRESFSQFSREFARELDATRHSRFRGEKNVAVEYLYPYWMLHEGRARRVPLSTAYRHAGYASLENVSAWTWAQLAALSVLRPKLLCLNDSFGGRPNPRAEGVVRAFLERLYPVPSRFERRDAQPSATTTA